MYVYWQKTLRKEVYSSPDLAMYNEFMTLGYYLSAVS